MIGWLGALLLLVEAQSLQLSRREWIGTAAAAGGISVADRAEAELTSRQDLLAAIESKQSDVVVLDIIQRLPQPSISTNAIETLEQQLDGRWELIWSYGAEGFSPLLTLPQPFRPSSFQYFGKAAASEVGSGRIAQGLQGGILGPQTQLWLSSGAIPVNDSTLEIQPPFRWQIGGPYGSGAAKHMIVEAGSDGDFRKTNGRSLEAQQAGKNLYQQVYLENGLRVSTVIAGDPVLVGEVFVHRKLQ